MAVELKLPELGENIDSGRVVGIKVKSGDKIEQDQVLMELETDKAVVEVPAEKEGVIEEVKVKEGDDVKVGQTLVTLGSDGKTEKSSEEKESIEEEKPKEEKEPEKVKEDKEEKESDKESEKEEASESKSKAAGKKQLVDFKIPELGENIESGSVANILVAVGDSVTVEQGLIEL
ncbi:MAG: biotin/lipoyl-binding protein, partial [Calditrichaceae bacterium]